MNDHTNTNIGSHQPFIRKFKWDDTVEDLMHDFGMTEEEALDTLDWIRYPDFHDKYTIDEHGNKVPRPPYPTWDDMDMDEHGHVWIPPRPGWKLPEWRRKELEERGITPPPDPQP